MSGGRGGRGGRGNGGGEGRGNGDGQGGRGNGGGPVPAFTVTEDMRINFTRQLLKLRDDAVTEVVFPNTLTNIERKFLHKLSEELGLKSRSHGKDENRRITVSKKEGATVGSDAAAPDSLKVFEMQGRTKKALASAFGDPASFVQANAGILDSVGAAGDVEHRGRAAASASSEASAIQASHEQMQAAMKKSPQFKSTQAKRASLPAASYKDDLCKLVRENQTVLVSGETGCGKTTQVPQYLLDDPVTGPTCRIVVTQPRRLSAISVAERIASERCEKLGGSIGYNIRLEQEKSKNTQVLFVTPGVLLRKLQNDPLLEEFTHIVIDEAHERDRFTEFLIMMVRDICLKRASMKLILMSATMHTNKLSSYFGGVPQVHLGGSVFPVQEFFLEDALKFTGYMADRPVFDTKGATSDRMNAYVASMNEYHCSQCTGGPFRSPEELGQHVAMCFTVAPADHRARLAKKKKTSLNELVSNLTRIITADGSGAAAAEAAAGQDAPKSSAGGKGKGKGKNNKAKGSKDVSKPVNFDSANGPQNLDDGSESDGSGGGGSDVSWDSDDEAGGDEEGTDRAEAAAVAAATAVPVTDEVDPEENALIKQYQALFDDTQVDTDLCLSLLRYIFKSEFAKDGSVLVFLPGWDDISRMARVLRAEPDFGGDPKFRIHQLHSGIPRKDQNLVFVPLKPGEHKIILSTNIAETSITIDDVAVVIDAGRMREKVYDPHVKLSYLKTEWVSQASARQRKGRAGRTRSGVCFHLFSKRRHTALPAFQDSELLRMPLEEIVLQTKILNVAPGKGDDGKGVLAFLAKALDPPHVLSILNAVELLKSINCLDESESITLVGRALAKLPMDPRIGRMIALGAMLGCGPAAMATAAAMGYRDPFVMPTSDQQRAACNRKKMELCRGFPSDQVGLYRAVEGFSNAWNNFGPGRAYAYCDDNFLSKNTMMYLRDLVQQLSGSCREVGLDMHRAYSSRNNGNVELLMSTVSMGLYPDVGVRSKGANTFKTEKGRKARVHAGSVNAKGRGAFATAATADLEFVGYQDLVALSQDAMHAPGGASLAMLNTQPVSLFCLLVCCGSLSESPILPAEDEEDESPMSPVDETSVNVNVDSWLNLRMHKDHVTLVQACRVTLARALDHTINQPGRPLPQELQKPLDAIVDCLTVEQQVVTPVGGAADVQQNRYKSQQANQQSRDNRDYKGAGGGRMKFYGGDHEKPKYKV